MSALPARCLVAFGVPLDEFGRVDWPAVDWRGARGSRLAVLIELASEDGARADVPESVLVEAVAAADRLAGWGKSTQLLDSCEVVIRHSRPDRPLDADARVAACRRGIARSLGERSVITELALARGESETATRDLVDAAGHLLGRFPATFEAMQSGRVSWRKVQTITRHLAGLPAHVAAVVEARALEVADGVNSPTLGRRLPRIIAEADPAGAERRHRVRATGGGCSCGRSRRACAR